MKAMVLGGVSPHIELICKLKEQGYTTILADYLDNPPAKKYADKYCQVSTLDKEAILKLAKEEQVDLVMTICVDHANVTMCYVAEQLGLPIPYSTQTAISTTDKGIMKDIMMKNDIPTSGCVVLKEGEQYNGDLEYPLVVKPVDNNGSKGVVRVDSDKELKQCIKQAMDLSRRKNVIVEEFNEGREIQVDCFANNGKAHIVMIREKLKIPSAKGLAMQSYGSILPPKLTDKLYNRICEVSQRIADGFGLEHTPFFFQAIEKDDDIRVLELTPRIGGGLSYKMLKRYAQFDVVDAVIKSYYGNIKSVDFAVSGKKMVTNIIYAVNGIFDRVTGVEQLLEQNIIESFDLMAEPGKKIANDMDSRNRIGAYYIVAENEEELKRKAAIAYDSIDVLDMDGNSIIKKDLYYH